MTVRLRTESLSAQSGPLRERANARPLAHTSAWEEREAALEQQADALLRALPRDPDYPAFTEPQLARHSRGRCVVSTDALAEYLAASASQSPIDELAFLASITPLTRRERACLRGWMIGWTQRELRDRWHRLFGSRSACAAPTQQMISRLLRSALQKCYSAVGLTFAQFSRHALYHRPARRAAWRIQRCLFCEEPFVAGLGDGRYCSTRCRESAHGCRAAKHHGREERG
ncbi:MAG TPA: hypothetical protein VFB21_22600 [Chthonomonadaceae bacterium]|nr:hypothetical protein [Chthonomonadaceae bacterium]